MTVYYDRIESFVLVIKFLHVMGCGSVLSRVSWLGQHTRSYALATCRLNVLFILQKCIWCKLGFKMFSLLSSQGLFFDSTRYVSTSSDKCIIVHLINKCIDHIKMKQVLSVSGIVAAGGEAPKCMPLFLLQK